MAGDPSCSDLRSAFGKPNETFIQLRESHREGLGCNLRLISTKRFPGFIKGFLNEELQSKDGRKEIPADQPA